MARPAAGSGSSTQSTSKASCPATAAFAPGFTMGELKAKLAACSGYHRDQEGQVVEENDPKDATSTHCTVKHDLHEKHVVILSATVVSVVTRYCLIFYIFLLLTRLA